MAGGKIYSLMWNVLPSQNKVFIIYYYHNTIFDVYNYLECQNIIR